MEYIEATEVKLKYPSDSTEFMSMDGECVELNGDEVHIR